jgi:ABC-2 type transport system permease protein
VERRRILFLLIRRDLKVKYSDSALGYLWTILDPLLMGLVYYFVFDIIFHRGGGVARDPYLLYLLSAMMAWQWASGCIGASCRTLSGESQLIRSVDVPREMWVLRMVGSNFVTFLFTLPVIYLFALGFQKPVSWEIAWVPIAMGMEFVALVGIGLGLAPLAVLIPDIERVIRVVVRVLTYLNPVLYGAYAVLENPKLPGWVREAYAWNPFTSILTMYRKGLFPQEDLPFTVVLRGGLSCVILLAIGSYIFRKYEREVLKEI